MAQTVFVAMSGGVDSSVAAYLLQRQGYAVVGATMALTGNAAAAVADAQRVAQALGIEHHVFELRDAFEQQVVAPFVAEYLKGRTPNPCILCNKNIKWEMFMACAQKYAADLMATGHYARITQKNGRYTVTRAASAAKDQTYALYSIRQEALARTLMPVGEYTKQEIRALAEEAGLEIYNKPDSQEICFVENKDYAGFIERYTGKKETPGDFVLADGTVLGTHKGISHYTIGQRKGLGIAYSAPLFVQRLDVAGNRVVLGSNDELFGRELVARDVNYMGLAALDAPLECIGKIRYAHAGAPCTVRLLDDVDAQRIHCSFHEPQRAITPGQSAVFYDEEGRVLFGGVIE